MTLRRLTSALLIGLTIAGSASAEVPHLIRYQGQAVDSQGVPLEGPYTLTFRLYDAETAGTKVWEEAQPNVPLQGGHFSVLLGQVTPLTTMDWSQPLWLSVQVGSDPELSPRQRITSVPLAIRAETAEHLLNAETISPHNLITNGSFESWSAGTNAPPDGWTLGGAGETAAKNATHVEYGLAAVDLHALTTDSNLMQNILVIGAAQNTTFRGKTVTFVCRVRASVAGRVRLLVDDGNTSSISPTHSGSGAYETLTVTHTIDAAATLLRVRLQIMSGTAATASFDGAILVVGSAPAAFSPHPRDALPAFGWMSRVSPFMATSSSTYVDVSPSDMVTITLPPGTTGKVLVQASVPMFRQTTSGTGAFLSLQHESDGAVGDLWMAYPAPNTGGYGTGAYVQYVFTGLSPGPHTFQLMYRSASNGIQASIDNTGLIVMTAMEVQ